MRDTLFLLPPGFLEGERRQYCPECAEAWGFLHYFPAIRETLDVVYEPLAHPRAGIVALLGEGRWNCPTLVLAPDAPHPDHPDLRIANDRRYVDSARGIGRYYAARFGTPPPR
jgi:hypothetical protein